MPGAHLEVVDQLDHRQRLLAGVEVERCKAEGAAGRVARDGLQIDVPACSPRIWRGG